MERLYIITGWTGMIGARLVNDLIAQKKKVCLIEFGGRVNKRAFKNVEYAKDSELGEINGVSENSILIHAASNANASNCNNNPVSAVESNINLTVEVLELCRKFSIKEFLFLSTGFLYGENERKAHRETDEICAKNVYLGTKLISEEIIKNFSCNHGLKSMILRLGNVFGDESNEQTVTGRIFHQINKGRNEIKLYTLEPCRDFVYVKDVSGAIQVVSRTRLVHMFDVLNVSSGKSTSIKNLVENICEVAGGPFLITEEGVKSDGGSSHILLDIKKIEKNYGRRPKYSLRNALVEIMEHKYG